MVDLASIKLGGASESALSGEESGLVDIKRNAKSGKLAFIGMDNIEADPNKYNNLVEYSAAISGINSEILKDGLYDSKKNQHLSPQSLLVPEQEFNILLKSREIISNAINEIRKIQPEYDEDLVDTPAFIVPTPWFIMENRDGNLLIHGISISKGFQVGNATEEKKSINFELRNNSQSENVFHRIKQALHDQNNLTSVLESIEGITMRTYDVSQRQITYVHESAYNPEELIEKVITYEQQQQQRNNLEFYYNYIYSTDVSSIFSEHKTAVTMLRADLNEPVNADYFIRALQLKAKNVHSDLPLFSKPVFTGITVGDYQECAKNSISYSSSPTDAEVLNAIKNNHVFINYEGTDITSILKQKLHNAAHQQDLKSNIKHMWQECRDYRALFIPLAAIRVLASIGFLARMINLKLRTNSTFSKSLLGIFTLPLQLVAAITQLPYAIELRIKGDMYNLGTTATNLGAAFNDLIKEPFRTDTNRLSKVTPTSLSANDMRVGKDQSRGKVGSYKTSRPKQDARLRSKQRP